MKKSNWIAMALCFLLLTGCSAGASTATASVKSFAEMTVEEQIEAATDYAGIMACIEGYWLYGRNWRSSRFADYTDANKAKLLEKIDTFLFTEGSINGTYYYNQKFLNSSVQDYGSSASYTLVVYSVGSDEIYLVPQEDAPANAQDIPRMSNASSYKYHIENRTLNDVCHLDTNLGEYYFPFTLQRDIDRFKLSIRYFANINRLLLLDRIPQQSDKIPKSQAYYADLNTSLSASQAEYDKRIAAMKELEAERKKLEANEAAEKAAEEELAKSDPQVGMTKSEVESCAWGKPDKKNIDEYAWGTSEQWVYKSKGYVYFKNGIVSSVSKR